METLKAVADRKLMSSRRKIESLYIDDRLSAGGGCEVVMIARTCGWDTARERGVVVWK